MLTMLFISSTLGSFKLIPIKLGLPFPITVQNADVPYFRTVKYLGIHLDGVHIAQTIKNFHKARSSLNMILSYKNKILIYKSLLLTILLDSSPIWTFANWYIC